LGNNGYTQIFNMLGGFDAWKAVPYEITYPGAGFDEVNLEYAYTLWGEGALFLDVRTASSFATGHILDAINIPVGELDGRTGELSAYLDSDIVVYCSKSTCGWAETACGILVGDGFTVVHMMPAGFEGWCDAGYEIFGDPPASSPFSCPVGSVSMSGPTKPAGEFYVFALAIFIALAFAPKLKLAAARRVS
jgi:rhodanese-related sulfurtransferase